MAKRVYEQIIAIRKKCQETEDKIRAELDLTLAEYKGLLALKPEEKIFAANFSSMMQLSPSRGSRVIERLIHRDFIKLDPVPNNRRSIHVSLTAAGIQMQKKIDRKMQECEEKVLSQLSNKQVKDIHKSLELLLEVL